MLCIREALDRLETDEVMGATWDDEDVSYLPNGRYAVCCTSCAERIIELAQQTFGAHGDVFGWDIGANATSIVAGPTHGRRSFASTATRARGPAA